MASLFWSISLLPGANLARRCTPLIGNLLWWLFGGLEAAIGYFTGSLALACTIIGIPWGKQHFKMAGLSLAPFGKDVELGF